MKRFENFQRVRVVSANHHLNGCTGTVVRLRRCDSGAWVNMDSNLPVAYQAFPDGDSRARHAMLYPDYCEAAERTMTTFGQNESRPPEPPVADNATTPAPIAGKADEMPESVAGYVRASARQIVGTEEFTRGDQAIWRAIRWLADDRERLRARVEALERLRAWLSGHTGLQDTNAR